jgi:hypothetical protein
MEIIFLKLKSTNQRKFNNRQMGSGSRFENAAYYWHHYDTQRQDEFEFMHRSSQYGCV